ncbi:MAG: thiolase domain-containing protein [Candidatus Aenigmarchaeota archaeon]|nr:thiolase domain-containing protein [Candidatus Aenigmarchaeota archaeon]MDI6722319.1 thiolase domain-containing protein [Candidatus Aenigmarchaeota archaeon]
MNTYVTGCSQTKFGELWDKSVRDLIAEAGIMALKDSEITKENIEGVFVGNMSAGRYAGQEHLGALAADCLGLNVAASRYEGACASGSIAFRNAYLAIKSGDIDAALVIGVEKMTDVKTQDAVLTLAAAGDQEWEASIGLTFASLYALIARRHMHEFGTTREQLALVSVNNHKNASGNKYAQFSNAITVDDVKRSPMVSSPLTVLDCSPITDGAAALVLVSDKLKGSAENHVRVVSSAQASDTIALHDRASLTEIRTTKLAAKNALERANLKINDIDFIELHDCFSINEIISIEDLGFCKKGDGGKFVETGEIAIGGSIPVNTTGGLKAIGHPVGATGVRQLVDITKQLRGDSCNQLKGVKYGMNLNIGGSGATAVVNILSNE